MLRAAVFLALAFHASAQWVTSRIHGTPEAPRPFLAEPAFTAISLHNALEMIPLPGARRFAAVENGGKIFTYADSPDAGSQQLLIDLKALHAAVNHAYGIAFHPQWRENGLVFITYTLGDKVEDGTRLSRFKLAQNDPPVLDPASETVLLTWLSGGHNGASLQFGPDGMLYCSTGDAEVPSPPDPRNTGQDLTDLLSSILRIDVDHAQNGKAYAIPADNPFLQTAGARPEIYAFGFRNPWKISFDAKGRLWCGDVGWELWEMIHLIQKGGNHGWSAMEASQPIKPELKAQARSSRLSLPIRIRRPPASLEATCITAVAFQSCTEPTSTATTRRAKSGHSGMMANKSPAVRRSPTRHTASSPLV
ncbi:MAG: PQQ-dependent sugar dehydrogenase [Verrucomicrobiaceae bacterium]|nr:PQQ-dependent sugar dehydrogenase [Verrucomicrobiaceae bacterium]